MSLQLLVMFGGSCYRWTVWYCVSIVVISCKRPDNKNDTAGIIDGDLILGGLFRIRKINGSNECNKDVEAQVGIQRVEAMLYAIHEINKNQTLLPNVTLGAEIRDTCSLKTKALDESLKFILDSVTLNSRSQQSEKCLRNRTKDLVGVVGPSRSTLSIEVAKLLRLFKVPQVSYASTSPELSNKNKYSYFSRTVPSDSLQAQAMIHVLQKFNWTSVFTVNSAGSYGENGIAEFKRLAKSKNSSVCVVLSVQVTDESTITDYRKVIEKFKNHPSTRAIVLFLKDNHVKNLLRAAKEGEYTKKVWIASDEWGIRADIVQNLDNFFNQSDGITLTLSSFREKKFETYFCDLCANKARRENPWFQQYWRQYNRICYSNNQTCNIIYNNKIPYVIEAVYAFANALHAMYKSKCPQMNGLCSAMRPVNKTELRDLILKGNGDSKGRYDVYHYYYDVYHHRSYNKLGEWQKELNLTSVSSRLNSITSTCNDTCNPWSRKVLKKETACCFECFDCPNKERQYVGKEN